MPLPNWDQLFEESDERNKPVGVAAAGGADPTVLEALSIAQHRGWVKPIVTGDAVSIHAIAQEHSITLDGFEILESESPAQTAVQTIHDKQAQLLMKGQIPTPELMKAVLDKEQGLRTGRVIAQMVLMEIPRDNRVFLMTDTGITIAPTLDQKADLLMHSIETAECLGESIPKIAIMAATEKVNEALPDTLDAEALVNRATSGEFGQCAVEGPLSFDLAYADVAGDRKRIAGQVVGQADAMLFPDLTSANLTVKAIMYTADCRFGGVLCGTTAPVVFMSRADDVQTRLRSLSFALKMLDHD